MVGIHILGSCNFESKNNDQKLKTFGFIKTGKPIALFLPEVGSEVIFIYFLSLTTEQKWLPKPITLCCTNFIKL
jgi:hypothetical protein